MTGLFITSSGTEIGKTFVTAALIHQLRAAGRLVQALKPVLSGMDDAPVAETDAGILLKALGRPADGSNLDALSPWRFGAPLSPDMAAAREGKTIPFEELIAYCRKILAQTGQVTLVEGVGGVLVPLTEDKTVLDWMAALGIPALLVVGGYLGTISHTLTAAKTLEGRGVPLAGVVISGGVPGRTALPVPLDETAAAIARFLPAGTPIRCQPAVEGPDAWQRAIPLLDVFGSA